ncbi:hypothetical protein [Paraherbaspirillum soli]|uniref:DUF5004 domain-containing protein n=1 Tax=Paraherbaspirillum soli TaxID=631222 RepID=A0ABW0MG30_9BURK
MKKFAIALVLVACVGVARADPKLIGQWKSDAELTMTFNRERARLEDKTLLFLEQMTGRQTITFTSSAVSTEMPDCEIQSALGIKSTMAGFKETHPYKQLGSTRTEVAISTREPVTGLPRITVYHFDGENTIWIYLGGETFPTLHLREYFVRVR